MLSGIKGFVEKSGSKITFGYDRILEKDGFGPWPRPAITISKRGPRTWANSITRTNQRPSGAER